MNEKQSRELAAMVGGTAEHTGGGNWWVLVSKPDGTIVCHTDGAVYHYRDRAAFESWHRDGDDSGLIGAVEFNG